MYYIEILQVKNAYIKRAGVVNDQIMRYFEIK